VIARGIRGGDVADGRKRNEASREVYARGLRMRSREDESGKNANPRYSHFFRGNLDLDRPW
jgi:hypothetical protein